VFKNLAGVTVTKASYFKLCVEYALQLEKICPVVFLGEVERTAAIHLVYDEFFPWERRSTAASFLELEMLFNLAGYVRAKGAVVPKCNLLHAIRLEWLLNAS
jgi:hypothetical protein